MMGTLASVTFLDPKTRTIVQKDVESPFEEYARFQNWQQYLGSLVINMAESIDDDERLERMADLVGFKYLEETLSLLDSLGNAPHEETQRAKAGFLAGLQA